MEQNACTPCYILGVYLGVYGVKPEMSSSSKPDRVSGLSIRVAIETHHPKNHN